MDDGKGQGLTVLQTGLMAVDEDHPERVIELATKKAKQLKAIVDERKLYQDIGGKRHLELPAWQILGGFNRVFASTEWMKPVLQDGKPIGWEARAVANYLTPDGRVVPISFAEGECLNTEANWQNRDSFAMRGMAQTRAMSRVLRNCFGWVAQLGGYAGTPAEEMSLLPPGWRVAFARFDGKCSLCEKPVRKGSRYYYNKEQKSARCADCVPQTPAPAPQAESAEVQEAEVTM